MPDPDGEPALTYCFISGENGIFCLRHGEIQPLHSDASAREQLAARGITDPVLLERASRLRPSHRPPQRWAFLQSLIFLFPAILVGFFFTSRWICTRMSHVIGLVLALALMGMMSPFSTLAGVTAITMALVLYLAAGALVAAALQGLARLIVPSPGIRFVATKGGSM